MINVEGLLEQIDQTSSLEQLEMLRIELLGKTGLIPTQMKQLGKMGEEERKSFGAEVNVIKQRLSQAIEQKRCVLQELALEQQLQTERLDVSLPVRILERGKIHPISQVIEEVTSIFAALGFSVTDGPDIDDDWHNFTALNIAKNHPARQMHDTFYLKPLPGQEARLLRTHTSTTQIRTMENGKPPFRIISSGRTYRMESDMTHTPMFHQIEGLLIDQGIHMGHLKSCIIDFLQKFFGRDDLPIRFRASFFPFTVPSVEVDIGYSKVGGELRIGGGDGWLEVLGCGMTHPSVLTNVGVDPEVYQGFAFGAGVERLTMLKYGMADLRHFFEGDIRFIKRYGFAPLDIPNLVKGLAR